MSLVTVNFMLRFLIAQLQNSLLLETIVLSCCSLRQNYLNFMPVLVKTFRKQSHFQGVGLFAGQDIQAGTKIWIMHDGSQLQCPNTSYDQQQMEKLRTEKSDQEMREFLGRCNHYIPGEILIHTTEVTNNINTSPHPNVKYYSNPQGNWRLNYRVTTRDVKQGQELTEDYSYGCKAIGNWVQDLYQHYLPHRIKFAKDYGIKPPKQFDWPSDLT